MAKELTVTRMNGSSRNILSILCILIIVGGAFAAWADLRVRVDTINDNLIAYIKRNKEAFESAKEDGCDPAKRNTVAVAILKDRAQIQ